MNPFVCLLISGAAIGGNQAPTYPVSVGKPAPRLQVGSWLKGPRFASFQKGQVYVVESWATWCQPCIAVMPHLSQLQSKYKEKVHFIGVDTLEEDFSAAGPFLREMGGKVNYSIAQDFVPAGKSRLDGAFTKTWLEGAGKYSEGLPLSFVIDGTGTVAWIGHPTELDGPLSKIVNGTWDLKAAQQRYNLGMAVALKTEKYKVGYYRALVGHDLPTAIANCDKVIQIDPFNNPGWAATEFRTLYNDMNDSAKAFQFARKAVEKRFANNAKVLSSLARELLYVPMDKGSSEMAILYNAARRADELTNHKDFAAVSLLAQATSRTGNRQAAIALQERALSMATSKEDKSMMAGILTGIKGRGGA